MRSGGSEIRKAASIICAARTSPLACRIRARRWKKRSNAAACSRRSLRQPVRGPGKWIQNYELYQQHEVVLPDLTFVGGASAITLNHRAIVAELARLAAAQVFLKYAEIRAARLAGRGPGAP